MHNPTDRIAHTTGWNEKYVGGRKEGNVLFNDMFYLMMHSAIFFTVIW